MFCNKHEVCGPNQPASFYELTCSLGQTARPPVCEVHAVRMQVIRALHVFV